MKMSSRTTECHQRCISDEHRVFQIWKTGEWFFRESYSIELMMPKVVNGVHFTSDDSLVIPRINDTQNHIESKF